MNIGVMLDNVGMNQPAFLAINRINANLNEGTESQYSVFYKEPSSFCTKLASVATTLDKAFSFNGVLIATNLDLALFMINALPAKALVLYLFELEWTKGYGNFLANTAIYTNQDIIVIAPSKDYAVEFENYCGRKPNAIIPQFNLNQIMKVVENEIRIRTSD